MEARKEGTVRSRPVARDSWLVRLMRLLVALSIVLAPVGMSQEMGDDARDALRQGQQRAALAMARYSDHFPDQPLWNEAIEFGERARRLAPDRSEPYRFLGQVYTSTGWYARAWNAWQQYRELGGEMDAQARSQLLAAASWLGFNSFAGGNYSQAITYLEEANELNSQDQLTLRRLAEAHIALGDAEGARPYAQELAQQAGDDDQAVALRERVDEYLEHGVEAVEALREAQSLYAEERYQAALERLRTSVDLSPTYSEALELAGRAALEADEPGEAVGYLQRLVELEPANTQAQDVLQLARNRAQFGTVAFERYEEGLAAFEANDLAAAEEWLTDALSANPELAPAHGLLGRIRYQENDYEAAEQRFSEAIRLDPSQSSYRFYLSATEEALRAQEDAIAEAEAQQEAEAQAQAEAEAVAQAEAEARAAEAERAAEAARAQAEAEAEAEAEARAQEQAEAEAEAQAQEQAQAEAEAQAQEQAQAEAEAQAQEQAQAEAAAPQQAETEEQVPDEPAAAESPATGEATASAPSGEDVEAQAQAEVSEAAGGASPETPQGQEQTALAAAPDTQSNQGQPEQEEAERAGEATASALVVADLQMAHTSAEQGGTGAFSFLPAEHLSLDLASPVDYREGTLHHRLEVASKPSDAPVHYQLCLVPNDDIDAQPACTDLDSLAIRDTGVYEAQQPLSTLNGFQGIDWSKGLESVILVIKDPSGLPIDSRYLLDSSDDAPDPSMFYPMEVSYQAVLVPPGSDFTGWQ